MASPLHQPAASFETAIMGGIRAQLDTIIKEEAASAQERVRTRVLDLAPQLAMSLLKHFDISRSESRYIITVKQELE